MQNPISYFIMLAKHWLWLVILGVAICGGATYVVSKQLPPTYQASANIILELGSDPTHAFDNVSASMQAALTYTQLITSPTVLEPVLANHPGMTLQQLGNMITVKNQPSTQIIEVVVQNKDPRLATRLANEICQSFAQFANTQLPGSVQILPALQPVDPVNKPSQYAEIGALVGLVLAVALIAIFEWIDERPKSPEQVQELMGIEVLTTISKYPRKQRLKNVGELRTMAEGCRIVCASLYVEKANKPFKSVLVTSALAGEGKSTIAANLAIFLATAGSSVLLVDANLRRPTLHRHFHLDNDEGFSNALLDKWTLLDVESKAHETEIPTLRMLTAGTLSFNPADLLQLPQTKQFFDHLMKAPFDYVIFDAPPILPLADAQLLASHIQRAVLVVDISKTSRQMLLRAQSKLTKTGIRILGTILNKSSWPDYTESRQYIQYKQQPKYKQQRKEEEITAISSSDDAPPTNGLVDLEITTPPPTNNSISSDTTTGPPMNGTVDLNVATTTTLKRPENTKAPDE